MSSEESSTEEGKEMLKVKKHSWRKPIDEMFTKLDSSTYSLTSPQARRQMKHRVLGEVSNRSTVEDAPKWVVYN